MVDSSRTSIDAGHGDGLDNPERLAQWSNGVFLVSILIMYGSRFGHPAPRRDASPQLHNIQ